MTATVSRVGLPAGSYVGAVTLTGAGQTLPVTLSIQAAGTPPPSPDGFSGSVSDIFSPAGLSGVSVTVGTESAITDASGRFSSGLPPSGVQPVALSGPGHVVRNTFASTNANLVNPLTMIPSFFDLAAFEDLAREASPGKTVRWTSNFSIYLDLRPEVGTGVPIPASWAAAAQAAAAGFPGQWTDGEFDPPVSAGVSPPADRTAGTIVIRFDNTINPIGCGGKVGQAQFSWSGSGELRWGVILLAFGRLSPPSCGGTASDAILRAVVGHEIGHTMGLGHSTLAGRSSLMQPTVGLTALSSLDHQVAAVQYHRAPGHSAPDRESSAFAGLNFSVLPLPAGPGEVHTFVCGGEADS